MTPPEEKFNTLTSPTQFPTAMNLLSSSTHAAVTLFLQNYAKHNLLERDLVVKSWFAVFHRPPSEQIFTVNSDQEVHSVKLVHKHAN